MLVLVVGWCAIDENRRPRIAPDVEMGVCALVWASERARWCALLDSKKANSRIQNLGKFCNDRDWDEVNAPAARDALQMAGSDSGLQEPSLGHAKAES